jgi:lysozyme family protein
LTATNRETSISKTLTYEGGYTNDPRDPGGATNWGITIADANAYWKKGATPADVQAMPKSVAIDIYRAKYWAVMGCDDRPTGPDFVDFDYGVNSGTGRVTRLRAVLDPKKLSPVDYVKQACAARSSFLHSLRTWSVFGRGWGSRVADVEATGVRMALGASGKPVAPTLNKEAYKAAKKAVAHAGGAAGTAAAPTSQVHHFPHISSLDPSAKAGLIFIGIAVAGVVIYFVWNAVKNAQRATAYAGVATAAAPVAAPVAPVAAPRAAPAPAAAPKAAPKAAPAAAAPKVAPAPTAAAPAASPLEEQLAAARAALVELSSNIEQRVEQRAAALVKEVAAREKAHAAAPKAAPAAPAAAPVAAPAAPTKATK